MSSYPGTLIRTNTNNFAGYGFRKINSRRLSGFFLSDEVTRVDTPEWSQPTVAGVQYDNIALTTERKTDILLVKSKNWPAYLSYANLSNKHKVQAAWASLAEILGKAIIYREDIEPSEISVGIRFETDNKNIGMRRDLWGIFIADNLDNGAGYSSNYASQAAFEELLQYAAVRIRSDLLAERHSRSCFTSCYDCLRHYSNRFAHAHLDWRLGLDLLDLLIGKEPSLSMTEEHWSEMRGSRLKQRFGEFGLKGLSLELVSNHALLRFELEEQPYGLVPFHPLVNMDYFKIDQIRDELSEASGIPIIPCCPYDLERQPLRHIQRIREMIKSRNSN